MFFRLRDYVRANATDLMIIELIAKMQRLLRTKEDEDKKHFKRVYVEAKEEDVQHLCALIKQLIGAEKISKQELITGFSKFCLVATFSEPKTKSAFDWEHRLQGSATETNDNDVPQHPAQKEWSKTKRPLNKEEAGAITNLMRGNNEFSHSLETLKDTHDVHTHALLSTLADNAVTETLVIQFYGKMRLSERITFMGRDRQLSDDSGLTNINGDFRKHVVNSYYESTSNRLYFVMKDVATASFWRHQTILIQQRMMQLLGLRENGSECQEGWLAKDEYEFHLIIPSGRLPQIQIWHFLHGVLKLTVKFLQRATPAKGQSYDPTVFRVVVVSSGCPTQIRDKTCGKWIGETIWLHHRVFYTTPPCITCAHPNHTSCPSDRESTAAYQMNLMQPELDVMDTYKEAPNVGSANLSTWIKQTTERQRERSLMGGEDVDAHEPEKGAPRGHKFVYVQPALRVRNIRLQHALKHYAALKIVERFLFWRKKAEQRPQWIEEQHAYRLPSPVFDGALESTEEQLMRVAKCAEKAPAASTEHDLEQQKQMEHAKLAIAKRIPSASADAYPVKPGVLTTSKGKQFLLSCTNDRHSVLRTLRDRGLTKTDKHTPTIKATPPDQGDMRQAGPSFPTRTLALRGEQHPEVKSSAPSATKWHVEEATAMQNSDMEAAPPAPSAHEQFTGDEDDSMEELEEAYGALAHATAREQQEKARQYFSIFQAVEGQEPRDVADTTQMYSESDDEETARSLEPHEVQQHVPGQSKTHAVREYSELEEKQTAPPMQSPPPGIWKFHPEELMLQDTSMQSVPSPRGRPISAKERFGPGARRNSTGTARQLFAPSSPPKYAREARRSASPLRRSSQPYTTIDSAEAESEWHDRSEWSEPTLSPSQPLPPPPSFDLLGSRTEHSDGSEHTHDDTSEASCEVEVVKVVPAKPDIANGACLATVDDYLNQYQGRLVQVDGDGHCWNRSLYAAVTGDQVADYLDRNHEKSNSNGDYYARHVQGTFQSSAEQLVYNNTFQWNDLFREFFHQVPPEDKQLTEAMVRQRIAIAAAVSTAVFVPQELWATTSVVMVTALFLRQALLVIDVESSTRTCAQLHYLDAGPRGGVDRIKTKLLSPTEAYRYMQEHFQHRTLPLVFFRTYNPTNAQGGHFAALRYEQHLYREWGVRDQAGRTMRDRLDTVYAELGLPIVQQAALPIDLTPPEHYEDASIYSPSDSSDEDALESSPPRTRSIKIDSSSYYALLECLPTTSSEVSTDPNWYTVLRANEAAFLRWKTRFSGTLPVPLGYKEVHLRAACHLIEGTERGLMALIRALPYPEVQLARTDSTRLVKLGRHCIQVAAAQRLRVYRELCSEDADKQAVDTWIRDLETDFTSKTWRTVTNMTKWALLGLTRYCFPQVEEGQWCLLTAVIMCMTEGFPVLWLTFPFDQQCHQVQEWLAITDNQPFARDILKEMHCANWSNVGSMLTDTISLIHAEAAAAAGSAIQVHGGRESEDHI